jgi:hypothetical protein
MGLFGLSAKEQAYLSDIKRYTSHTADIEQLLKKGKVSVAYHRFGVSVVDDVSYPQLFSRDQSISANCEQHNKVIQDAARQTLFARFSSISTRLLGSYAYTQLVALSLFAREPLHTFIVTDCLDVAQLQYYTSLGQTFVRTTQTGPDVSGFFVGDQFKAGLLSQSSGGTLFIQDPSTLLVEDLSDVVYAMKHGVLRFEGRPQQASCSVVAIHTDSHLFSARTLGELRSYIIPTKLADASHFLLVVRQSAKQKFFIEENPPLQLTSPADRSLVTDYISYASSYTVVFPSDFFSKVVSFITTLKEREPSLLRPVSEVLVTGVVRLSCAHARLRNSTVVEGVDLKKAMDLLQMSLECV